MTTSNDLFCPILITCSICLRIGIGLSNLIESSRGTRKRGRLTVYAMHLMELSERSSAISMVHKACYNGLPFWNKKSDGNDQMVIAFEAYKQLSSAKIRPATAISSLNDMHEDICACAHQKTVAMILFPFHKYQKLDGTMESVGHSFQVVNEHVLRHAPCLVGILVDRGFGGTTPLVESSDCVELGPIESFLASLDFSFTASVVVIQQYDATASRPLVVEEVDYELPESSFMV